MKSTPIVIISVILALYAGLHIYAYKKIVTVVSMGQTGHMAIALFLVLMIIAPFLVSMLTHRGLTAPAIPLAWVGYSWMGFVFLFFVFSLALDLSRSAMAASDSLLGLNAAAFMPSTQQCTLIAVALALLAAGYGYFAARQINTEWTTIRTPKLDQEHDPIRIAQISDLHLGLTTDKARLEQLIEIVKSAEPDIVVSTGDLLDMQLDHLGAFADLLRELKPRLGKYAVTGNHEAFAGIDQALAFTRRAGFTVLSNEGIQVGGIINIVGVDDPTVVSFSGIDPPAERELLQRLRTDVFTLLLKHQPVISRESLPWFDLQLSGHTHKGQIFPFTLLVKLFYPAKTGLSQVGERAKLYVSRGTGTWGPPIRFLAPPELTIIELQPLR